MKTTPYLGGQIRIDLVSDRVSGDSSIVLDEVHVMPLSDRIWFSGSENQLNNHHTDNIVELYNGTQDTFYKCLGDRLLEGKYPYFSGKGTVADTVDHTYQMGLRREPVSRYGKNLSFLIPMWIDSEDYIDDLDFFVNVESITGEGEDSRNTITIKKFEMSDRLREYLKEYLRGVSSDLMYIGIREHSAYITGLDVSNGTVMTKDISNIVPNLTERERPLLETDNMLVRQFSENKMIARQLMNFNIVFSVSDLFSPVVEPSLRWSELNIWCEARLKDHDTSRYRDIEIRDIYSNYTDIYSFKIDENPIRQGSFVESYTDGSSSMHFNVLDYMDDYSCIDMIHLNRMLQPNFHWSFTDNDKYTWNLYNGFSPIVSEGGSVSRVEGRFFGTPDVFTEEYSMHSNNVQWMTVIDGVSSMMSGSFIGQMMNENNTSLFAPNEYGNCWVKGIKYGIGDTLKTDTGGSEATRYIDCDGIRANMVVVKKNPSDHLEIGNVYCAVLGRAIDGTRRYDCYVSMVYVVEDEITDEMLDKMTNLGVRRLIADPSALALASADQNDDVFMSANVGADDAYALFNCYGGSSSHDPGRSANMIPMARSILSLFSKVLGTIEYPNIVRFGKTLTTKLAPGPSIEHLDSDTDVDVSMRVKYTSEMQYETVDNGYSTYLMRYDGNIIPQFIPKELDEPVVVDGCWRRVDNGAFNMVWSKDQMSLMDISDIERLNYISRQKYDPDYPSIGYYYIHGEKVRFDEPPVPQGYLGEVCWTHSNKMYYSETSFTVEFTVDGNPSDDIYLEKFFEYASDRGVFQGMDDGEKKDIICNVLWPLYKFETSWEYSSDTSLDSYNVKVVYSLK